jgi:hypothetical protein
VYHFLLVLSLLLHQPSAQLDCLSTPARSANSLLALVRVLLPVHSPFGACKLLPVHPPFGTCKLLPVHSPFFCACKLLPVHSPFSCPCKLLLNHSVKTIGCRLRALRNGPLVLLRGLLLVRMMLKQRSPLSPCSPHWLPTTAAAARRDFGVIHWLLGRKGGGRSLGSGVMREWRRSRRRSGCRAYQVRAVLNIEGVHALWVVRLMAVVVCVVCVYVCVSVS